MPQQMRGTSTGARYASAAKGLVDDMRDGGRRESIERCIAADKQPISVGSWTTFFQVGHDRVTDFLGQRQSRVATALTTNMNPGALPIDVTQAEVHDVACPKAKAGEQQQDRPLW